MTCAGPVQFSSGSRDTVATSSNRSIHSAAHDFESVLLNQWLQPVESSVGDLSGDEDDESGDQMKSLATQVLAGQLAAQGGLGIGRLVENGLLHANGAGRAAKAPSSNEATMFRTNTGMTR